MKQNKISAVILIAVMAALYSLVAIPAPAKAVLSTNASADVVIGQANMTSNSANQGGSASATNLYMPRNPFYDGNKFFVADTENHRVLIYNSIPTSNNASADVVIGQTNLTSGAENQGGAVGPNTLKQPACVFSDGTKLFICDTGNHRVLIFNSIPASNNTSADIVVGQTNMTTNSENQGSTVGPNTLNSPFSLFFNGKKLFISDWGNNRVLIFNSLPTSNNTSADIVLGQTNMTSNSENQGSTVNANTMDAPNGIYTNGKKLFIVDQHNHRILIFNSVPEVNNASADIVMGQQNMTSNSANQGGSVAANTMYYPTHVFPYGPKLVVLDAANSRALIYNSIPASNNASADVVIGQASMSGGDGNQTGNLASPIANGLYVSRGVIVASQKLIIGDFWNNRVLIYNSFGSQWTINKNKSRTLSGDEKLKVEKKKLKFSGKKKVYKKGRVKIYRDGNLVKSVKIKKSGKWSTKFKDTGSAVKEFVLKYYNSSGELQMNSETYVLGINRGSLVEATLEKASFSGSVNSDRQEKSKKPAKFEIPDKGASGG